MKRYILLFICLFGIIEFASAQKTYVVAFDCTRSMNHPSGIYDDKHEDPTVLWIPAKECIHSLWKQASDEDMFHIILFQQKTLRELHEIKANLSWSAIEHEMECAICNGGNTCLYNAWMDASKYTDDCDFYFITDGVEDHDNKTNISKEEQEHIDAICKLIKEFCRSGNRQGFYTNIQQSENDKITNQITETIRNSCFNSIVAGNLYPQSISLNQTDINDHGKDQVLQFKAIDKGQALNVDGIKADIICDDGSYLSNASDYFSVSATDICNGKMTLSIKTTGKDVPLTLLNDSKCQFRVKVVSNGKKAIFPQEIIVTVQYYIEKIAYLPSNDFKGKSKYHPAFFVKPLVKLFPSCDWIAEHKPDTIQFDIKQALNDNVLFNDEARKRNSAYKLIFDPLRKQDNKAQFAVLKNGIVCPNNVIDVNSADEELVISIVFSESSAEGKFRFNLVPSESAQLDKINECANISEAAIPISIEYDVKTNPLQYWIVKFLEIVLVYIVVRLMVMRGRVLAKRKFVCGTIRIFDKEGKAIILKELTQDKDFDLYGYTKCIITNKKPTKDQSYFDEHFRHGKIGYIYNRSIEIEQDIIIVPLRDDSICILEESVKNGKVKELNVNNIRIRITNK